jgi:glycosyltransferase involved in cell wall biosynthesis
MKTIQSFQSKSSTVSVAAFLQCTNLGGMEQVAYSLFEQLRPRGFDFRVITPRSWGPGKPRVLNIDPKARAFDYKGKFGWRSFPAFQRHAKTVCNSNEKVWVTGTCVSCLAAAHLSGKKILLSHHYHHFENRKSWWRWKAFYLAFGKRLDAITYPTEFTRNEALRIAPWLHGKTYVVRCGIDIHYQSEVQRLELRRSARTALGIPQDAFVLGNAGWLIKRKRFDVFLRTAQIVSRQLPNARFYICGGGPEENHLRSLARELGIAEKLHFQGWVQDMTPYYQAWDVVLFNTDFDALGRTPLEAASHGCLSVASCYYGGLGEFLDDGNTGFLLDKHDPEKLAEIIIQLAMDPMLALKIRLNAIKMLENKFSAESALNFYENYFKSTAISS